MLNVVIVCAKVFSQVVEQRLIRSGIRRPDVVDGINKPLPHQLGPDAIGHHMCKERIGLVRHPLNQSLARVLLGIKRHLLAGQRSGRDRLPRAAMVKRSATRCVNQLFTTGNRR